LASTSSAKVFAFDVAHEVLPDPFSKSWAATPRAARAAYAIDRGGGFVTLWGKLGPGTTFDRTTGKETAESRALKEAAKQDLRRVVSSMLSEPTTHIYATEWSMQDDTNVFGVLAFNERTGTMNIVKVIPAS